MEMAASMRLAGAVVNYNIVIAIAKGIITANDRTILTEYGGTVQLGFRWCLSIFARMKWTKRKGTTAKPTIAPGLIKEVGLTFYKDIAEIVQTLNIPPELIINIDQTPIPYILISKYSMNQKNAKNVPIQGTGDYRQITGTLGVTEWELFGRYNSFIKAKRIDVRRNLSFQLTFMLPKLKITGRTRLPASIS